MRKHNNRKKALLKRILAILIALLMLAGVFAAAIIPARAAEVTLGEIKAVLTLPDGWTEAEKTDGALLEADNAEGVHLRLSSITGETSEDQWNYGDYGDSVVENLGKALADRLKKADYTDVGFTLVKADLLKWLRLVWTNGKSEKTLYGIQYYTVVNGQGIELSFTSAAPLSEETAAQAETIVQSLSFAEIMERPKTSDSSMKTSLIWIAGLVVAAGFTYWLTTRGKKK
ncbi:MAG: hypothetical protein II795_03665 [Firmicutes bacterium]|nr:hypothetical protein [Bacillota bacterium]